MAFPRGGAAVALAMWLPASATVAMAGACLDNTSALGCGAIQQRLDGLLVTDPVGDRADQRLSGSSTVAPAWSSALVALATPAPVSTDPDPVANGAIADPGAQPAANPLGLQTSIAQWSSFASQATVARLQNVKTALPDNFALPPLSKPDPVVDAWFSYDNAQLGVAGSDLNSRMGADYKLGALAVVGVAVANQQKDGGTTTSQTIASYFAMKPLQTVTIDGRIGLVESHLGPLDGALDTSQRFVSTRIKSDVQLGAFKLSPALTLAHGDETLKDAAPATNETNRLAFSPRLSRPFDLGSGTKLEPFVTLDRNISLDQQLDPTVARPANSIGGGVSLKKDGGYSLDVTSSVEDTPATTALPKQTNVKSRLELKVPIK